MSSGSATRPSRARVEGLMRALGLGEGPAPTSRRGPSRPRCGRRPDDVAAARRQVLERLARREIDPVAAAAELRALGGA